MMDEMMDNGACTSHIMFQEVNSPTQFRTSTPPPKFMKSTPLQKCRRIIASVRVGHPWRGKLTALSGQLGKYLTIVHGLGEGICSPLIATSRLTPVQGNEMMGNGACSCHKKYSFISFRKSLPFASVSENIHLSASESHSPQNR